MVWFTKSEQAKIRTWFLKLAPYLLVGLFLLIIGFITGYEFKGDEIYKDCKYANAFRVGHDSFNCTRKI